MCGRERENHTKKLQWGTESHKGILLKQSYTGVVKASVYTPLWDFATTASEEKNRKK